MSKLDQLSVVRVFGTPANHDVRKYTKRTHYWDSVILVIFVVSWWTGLRRRVLRSNETDSIP
jgi:hypothetical protein